MAERKDSGNSVVIPEGAKITAAGYVYGEIPDIPGSPGTRMRIGKVIAPGDGVPEGRMEPNRSYPEFRKREKERVLFLKRHENCQRPIYFYGYRLVLEKLAMESGLLEDLCEAFGGYVAGMLMDMAQHAVCEGRTGILGMPYWARDHVLFMEEYPTEREIRSFLKNRSTVTQDSLKKFRRLWARRSINGEQLMIFPGFTGKTGHPDAYNGNPEEDLYSEWDRRAPFDAIDIVYVCREDGLPVTFFGAPGDVFRLSETENLFRFWEEDEEQPAAPFTLACTWLPLTEQIAQKFSTRKAGALCVLKPDSKLSADVLKNNMDELKKPEHRVPGSEKHVMTVAIPLFRNRQKKWYFHLTWDPEWEKADLEDMEQDIPAEEKILQNDMKDRDILATRYLDYFRGRFLLETEPAEDVCEEDLEAYGTCYRLLSVQRNEEGIAGERHRAGGRVIVSSRKMKAVKARSLFDLANVVDGYLTSLMYTLNQESLSWSDIHHYGPARILWTVWFITLILENLLDQRTDELTEMDPERFSRDMIRSYLRDMRAERDYSREDGYLRREGRWTEKYEAAILSAVGISSEEVEEFIAGLRDEPYIPEDFTEDDDDGDDFDEYGVTLVPDDWD